MARHYQMTRDKQDTHTSWSLQLLCKYDIYTHNLASYVYRARDNPDSDIYIKRSRDICALFRTLGP
jgi:hypothetical protein